MAKVYFDMDGVLADFEGYFRDNNIAFKSQSEGQTPEQEAEMWKIVSETPHFYHKLKPMPGAIELFKELSKTHDCEILSAIPKPFRNVPTAAEDKRKWVEDHLGKDVKANIVYRHEKIEYCKDKSDVLIDDYDLNIKEWTDKGGTGVLFEDAKSAYDTFKKLTEKQPHKTTACEKIKQMAKTNNQIETEDVQYGND